jgi:hypothetical protein
MYIFLSLDELDCISTFENQWPKAQWYIIGAFLQQFPSSAVQIVVVLYLTRALFTMNQKITEGISLSRQRLEAQGCQI